MKDYKVVTEQQAVRMTNSNKEVHVLCAERPGGWPLSRAINLGKAAMQRENYSGTLLVIQTERQFASVSGRSIKRYWPGILARRIK